MKLTTGAGAVLIALGLMALIYQGINYTSRETMIDIGPLHATVERQRTLPIPPLLSLVVVVAGVALLVAGTRRA